MDHAKRARNLKYFRKRMAINAVQIWVLRIGEVPTKDSILRFCLMVLKKLSLCQRSLSMAAMVVNTKVRWTVRGMLHSFIPSFHTSIFRMGYGYFFFDR